MFVLLTPPTASLSSTVDLVSVPLTLLVSFPSNKKVVVLGGFCIHGHFWAKRTGFSRRRKAATEVVDGNDFYDSTMRNIVHCSLFTLSKKSPYGVDAADT